MKKGDIFNLANNGVLNITLPKLQEVKQVPASRHIEVK